jgi:negative regulator of flagellin synthesis FlgM
MKIDPTLKTTAPSPVAEERTRTVKQQPAEKPAEQDSASVKLSSLSSQLQEIEARMDTSKAVDSKRVAEIKRSIEDGSFKVDANVVADRLIEGTRDYLRAQKQ